MKILILAVSIIAVIGIISALRAFIKARRAKRNTPVIAPRVVVAPTAPRTIPGSLPPIAPGDDDDDDKYWRRYYRD